MLAARGAAATAALAPGGAAPNGAGADAGATEFPPGDYGGLEVHMNLREAAKDYDPENQTDVPLTCRPRD